MMDGALATVLLVSAIFKAKSPIAMGSSWALGVEFAVATLLLSGLVPRFAHLCTALLFAGFVAFHLSSARSCNCFGTARVQQSALLAYDALALCGMVATLQTARTTLSRILAKLVVCASSLLIVYVFASKPSADPTLNEKVVAVANEYALNRDKPCQLIFLDDKCSGCQQFLARMTEQSTFSVAPETIADTRELFIQTDNPSAPPNDIPLPVGVTSHWIDRSLPLPCFPMTFTLLHNSVVAQKCLSSEEIVR